jgi:hypothetical protein
MILVNGASMTLGHGLADHENPWPHLLFQSFHKNIAEPGSSNQSIFRRSIEELYLNPYQGLVVAWVNLHRFEWADNYGQVKTFLLNQFDNQSKSANIISRELLLNWHNEYWYFKQFLLMLSSLNLHCKHLGVKFFCLQTGTDLADCYQRISNDIPAFLNEHHEQKFTTVESLKKEHDFIVKLLDETADCWILNPSKSMIEFYSEHIISAEDLHPTHHGHVLIADNLRPLFKSDLDKYTKLE